ncbi:Choline kinase [Lachnellula cervina]|uniref:Choline kinase n=1 Tax=Lachnellula cervina TaxID=1316786 RepID=A0A7D8UVK2_9HELO|nr:Choline kinase [Lachnellula cervina]
MIPTPASSENGSTSSNMPLRPALKPGDEHQTLSPRIGPKVVSISEPEPEPEPEPSALPEPLYETYPRHRQHSAGVATRRLSGRPGLQANPSSRLSLVSQSSLDDSETGNLEQGKSGHEHGKPHHEKPHHEKLLTQVAGWLQAEKAKRAARRSKKRGGKSRDEENEQQRPRTGSQSSDSSAISLEKLQRIIEDNMSAFGIENPLEAPRRHGLHRRRHSSARGKLAGFASSDTEYQDGDIVVPSCDVVLDNSKTMSFTGGGAVMESSDTTVTMSTSRRVEKEKKAWLQFKSEIVRLAHTLRLKGWRRVPLERGGEIEVERLSGALTNAVYVVSPPKELPSSEPKTRSQKPPPKLLLRIYGPQVEHLIDRENELGILRRLARKKIGPRLLGTFRNGRFEEFFNAQTLKAEDLRVEDTMKQIAKRMRELHEGVDLLDREREEGPFVLRNWDKWVDRCQEVITYLDGEILSQRKGKGESWRERGLVCGVEWKVFKGAVDRYRKWLEEYYKMRGGVGKRLVFAHNDTQYGNILRLIPPTPPQSSNPRPPPSPLLLPQNHHKQLIVIDFEYASANTPGLEFANHFTEWCYNYASPTFPEACHTSAYPSVEQQKLFIKNYVNHRPQFNARTPKMQPMDSSSSSIASTPTTTTSGMRGGVNEFLLDSRAPGGGGASTSSLNLNVTQDHGQQKNASLRADEHAYFAEEEQRCEAEVERQVLFLMEETRVWRVANSAQWVAWGIVQAKLPADCPSSADTETITGEGVVDEPEQELGGDLNVDESGGLENRPEGVKAEGLLNGETVKESEKEGEAEGEGDGEDDSFDYLAYAKERALFFWGDVVALGIVSKEELPGELVAALKVVEY